MVMGRHPCDDCGGPVRIFMVHHHLWPYGADFVCLACFETRTGRLVTVDDLLPEAPCNDWLREGEGRN